MSKNFKTIKVASKHETDRPSEEPEVPSAEAGLKDQWEKGALDGMKEKWENGLLGPSQDAQLPGSPVSSFPPAEAGAAVTEVAQLAEAYSAVDAKAFTEAALSPEQREDAAKPLNEAAAGLRESGGVEAEPAAQSLDNLAQELRTGDAGAIEAAQGRVVEEVAAYQESQREMAVPDSDERAATEVADPEEASMDRERELELTSPSESSGGDGE